MKKLMIGLVLLAATSAVAQDTIYTRNGETVAAKVYEITSTEIKYRKPSNPDGPLYVMSKDDVAVIEYKNGSKDVFQKDASGTTNSAQQNGNQVSNGNTATTYYAPSRPRVNVVIAPPPVVIGAPGWGYYYRPYRYHRHWRRGCW